MKNLTRSPNIHDKHRTSNAIIYHSRSSSFENYLKWTDEKEKTVEEILKIISAKQESLLDIGAGTGKLTKLLASKFNHITAIEPSLALFKTLKKECFQDKYTLINKPFELVTLEKQYDVIIMSFSLDYIQHYDQEILRIRDHLKETGTLLIVEIDQKNSELNDFHLKYRKAVLGTDAPEQVSLAFGNLLKKTFTVKETFFTTILTIPSVKETMGLFEFIYDTKLSNMNQKALMKIEAELYRKYGDCPIKLSNQNVIYICSKKHLTTIRTQDVI